MNDSALFAVAPYVAVSTLALVLAARCVRAVGSHARGDRANDRSAGVPLFVGTSTGFVALCLVLLGHAVLLLAPDAVLRWNRSTVRLLSLEALAVCLGTVAVAGVLTGWFRSLFSRRSSVLGSVWDQVLLTLVTIEAVSGLALAVNYRWASSWSAVTLVPYVGSLFHLTPRVELVSATPFLVRLHLFCTFAIVAVVPFTRIGGLAVHHLAAAVRIVSAAARPARRMLSARMNQWARRGAAYLAISGEEEI